MPTGDFHRSRARCAARYQLRFSSKIPQTFSGALGGGVIQPETRKTARHTQTATGAGLISVFGVRDIIGLVIGLVKKNMPMRFFPGILASRKSMPTSC